jgi:hypothetical protein
MLWCWLGQGVSGILVATLLVALGDAFRSGADEALIYRTCVALGREDDFQEIEARAGAAELTGLVVLILAGGVIVSRWGFASGWIAETVLAAAGLAMACAMVEPPRAGVAAPDHRRADEGRVVSRRIVALVIPVSVLIALASTVAFIAQTEENVTVHGLTMLVALFTIAEAAGSLAAIRVGSLRGRGFLAIASAGGVCFLVALTHSSMTSVMVIVLAFLAGLAEPLRSAAIQREASDERRARTASFASACDTALSTLVLPLFGAWRVRRR